MCSAEYYGMVWAGVRDALWAGADVRAVHARLHRLVLGSLTLDDRPSDSEWWDIYKRLSSLSDGMSAGYSHG